MIDLQAALRNLDEAVDSLRKINPIISGRRSSDGVSSLKNREFRLQKVLVANRGEIAKRFFLALHEEGIPSVAVVTDPDRGQSWYEFADEVIFIGDRDNYANRWFILGSVVLSKANAVYSGYGFLSESPDFVEAIDLVSRELGREIVFMGPHFSTMRMVGDKINARKLAGDAGIPLFTSSNPLRENQKEQAVAEALRIGFPVMMKLRAGGGGKGMKAVYSREELLEEIDPIVRIGRDLYGDTSFYLEEYIKKPVHIEVQIFNGWAIGIRKCAVQRRNQKIIEESGHTFLDDYVSLSLLAAAEKIAAFSGYDRGGGAGTVEFLIDGDTGRVGFIEVNTRLQVEYAVTDQSLGIDLARWQILYYDGRENEITGIEALKGRIAQRDHSIECRIYAEEPENNYLPSPGMITVMDLPTFNGVRCDFGFSEGDSILSMYDPMIGKIIAHGSDRREAVIRMERALQELYIKGVKTNVNQLLRIIRHDAFVRGDYTNNLLAEYPELNSLVSEDSEEDYRDRRKKKHVIFGAFSEYIHLIQRSVREFLIVANIENIIDSPVVTEVPSRFVLEYGGKSDQVEFVQIGIDTYLAYVNGAFNGRLIVISVNARGDDFLINYGNGSYRVRINRYAEYLDLRMRGDDNKIQYFRVSVRSDREAADRSMVLVRSPFQGTFINFCREGLAAGAAVSAGEPLVVLSSMKMETTLSSPCTGKITELIGDGDLSKLLITRTADGRIIGKSVRENELLFKIKADETIRTTGVDAASAAAGNQYGASDRSAFDLILREEFEARVQSSPLYYLDHLIELLYAAERGMISSPVIIDRLVGTFRRISERIDFSSVQARTVESINMILRHYARIKRLFSPVLAGEGLSFPQELSLYIHKEDEHEEGFSEGFRSIIASLFEAYGLAGWEGRADVRKMFVQYSFVLFKRSYQFCLDQTDVVKDLVHAVSMADDPGRDFLASLNMLLETEESEKDDSLLKIIRKIIEDRKESAIETPADAGDSIAVRYKALAITLDENKLRLCRESLDSPEETLLPESCDDEFAGVLSLRLEALAGKKPLKRLYSPHGDIFPFIVDREDSVSYCILGFCAVPGNPGAIADIISRACGLLCAYGTMQAGIDNWIDVTLCVRDDFAAPDRESVISYSCLREASLSAMPCFENGLVARGYFHFHDPGRSLAGRTYSFWKTDNRIVMDMLHESDRSSPYYNLEKTSLRDQRLFNIGKWPIELWAGECFDEGSIREITIESIDGADMSSRINPMTGMRPVGAKIFQGKIHGIEACFYMKDSRVSGGSTGSREGLKYIAAVYLSYLKDWPLYVWNDSAGANIGEGIVSLNRGAEGFMMNSLVVQRADAQKFSRYIRNVEDPQVRELFQELHSKFNLSFESIDRKNRRFFLVAAGIGSSAGLDVYGSSQATVQVLLDSDQSYRVLTGSNVIRTVIGENISNYDIGGAKILGVWTGIVDIIASDKLHMVSIIRRLQSLFCREKRLPSVLRIDNGSAPERGPRNGMVVFSESVVKRNVDGGDFWAFKNDYYASEALVGGFAKLGGRRVLVMGPRTNYGLRSISSIIRARELLKMAERTGSPQIFVFGKKWHQHPDYHENISMRSRLDFVQTMQCRSVVRIHIITHVDGLKLTEITGNSDAIIYITNSEESNIDINFARQNSSFIVRSFEEAFDLSLSLIDLIDPVGEVPVSDRPGGVPTVPDNPAEPYDIIESIVNRVFDENTFVEFYRDMNDPVSGPHLVTGLARLHGRTVGVIADQPMVKGGGADAFGTEKFRVFIEFLNRNRIPLVMLSNSSGFVPGSQQERYRIQAIGAESLDANILGEIPVVSVVLNQNYGGRLIHAFNKFLRPGIVYLALDRALMAVIGADAAFELLFGKKYERLHEAGKTEEAEKVRSDFMESYLLKARASNDALATGLVDWLIHDISELRAHLVQGLNRSFQRCREAFGGRWDDIQSPNQ
ncbi:MAG TPA: carboxyl transferase domain-containing protein [Spirochaetota bacterium]|nr:carboxyl transferase domain-containing protein [Spirochaetota bacterium]